MITISIITEAIIIIVVVVLSLLIKKCYIIKPFRVHVWLLPVLGYLSFNISANISISNENKNKINHTINHVHTSLKIIP